MTYLTTNSTRVSSGAGSAPFSSKYDDVQRQSELTSQSLLNDYTFVATVIEVNQQLQSYQLRAAGLPDMVAVQLEWGGQGTALATKCSSLYGVGSVVLAMTTPALGINQAVILGSFPGFLGANTSFGSPELAVSSPVGALKDVISDSGPLNCVRNNFNYGRPVDAYPGDTTVLNSLGCGLFIGSTHATLTSGLDCSLECHYFDSLVRLNSFNFEHSTSGAETLMFADAGDYTEIKRLNPYIVESLGGTQQYGSVPKADAADRADKPDPSEITGTYKPEDPEQTAWWRWLDMQGYLANLKLNFAVVPKLEAVRTTSDTSTQDEVGVFREHVDSTGAYSVVSAKSISFIKDCFIPVPREKHRPDDSRGDDADSISQARSSNSSNMADFTIEGAQSDVEHGSILYAAASSDAAAFKAHRSTVAFRERPNDWTMQEIDDIDLAGFKTAVESSGFISAATGVSQSRMFAQLPKVGTLRINAREAAVKYFASRSMIMMHEDGSIHIQDGYGSTISMRGGGIDISCPGDITLRPGKNVVALAGDSVSVIAGNDVELSANVGDLRLQADRNVSVLAGNDGQGGILLESKAEASNLFTVDEEIFDSPINNSNSYGGIWLKAPASGVAAVSSEFYAGNRTSTCTMYLDSGDDGSFTMNGRRHVFQGRQTTFITNKDNPDSGSNVTFGDFGVFMKNNGGFFLQGSSFMAAGLKDDMQFLVKGSALFSQSVRSSGFAGLSTQVGRMEYDAYQEYLKKVDEAIQQRSDALKDLTDVQIEQNSFFESSMIGDKNSSLKNLTFCYPDSTLRGVPLESSFVMFEADWQQAYRAQGAGSSMILKGVDPSKESGQTPPGVQQSYTYFWPGGEALSKKFGKMESQSRFVDDKLRFKSSGYDSPVVLSAAGESFEGNYTIISPNQLRVKE